mmetsp:Transcript_100270/g.323544  ORF Transcript_100270/g.323544 Transcript_100270/m.323544 type:complete len:382 (-) Transcript_100270:17-1162(-)
MGRKKRPTEDAEENGSRSRGKDAPPDSDDERYDPEPRHYDIDPDIQELAYTFSIDPGLTQRLNDIMIEERQRTWEQDLARLYEILKDAHTPAAMLNLKLRDMEKGTFVGKAKCQMKVREMASRHRLDKGASTKLEEAMSMREAMGKDVEKDLILLDEHLAASNAPSKLISMKLDSLRKGFNIGHCIYSREPMPGNQGPGVDGVFDKRGGKRTLGYTDADLDKRFAEQDVGSAGGQLMDEATVRRLMAAERQQHEALLEASKAHEAASRSRSRKRKRKKSRGRSASGKRKKSRSRSSSTRKKPSRGRSSSSPRPKKGRARSGGSPRAKRSRGSSGSPKKKKGGGKKSRSAERRRSRSRRASSGSSSSPRRKDAKEKKGGKKK